MINVFILHTNILRMKKIVLLLMAVGMISANCLAQKSMPPKVKKTGHPAWISQGNIYEVNVRQYTKEGTFKAFQKHLDRLKDMGVQTLWFMPINPISVADRKGALGSYYAVADYTGINPEYGTMKDWKNLVDAAHVKGFKVIIDWVANHTGADNHWITEHPNFYVRDASGKFLSPFDWTDTRKLNFDNEVLHDSMINAMKFWITNCGIDGFRCDVAAEVPAKFWSKCIKELHKMKNVFMLAESNEPWIHKAGFDATYAWSEFAILKDVAKGRSAKSIDSALWKNDTAFVDNAWKLYFTSNHDENSWNKADYATMPGAVHAPFAVLTQTIKKSIPLIYSGQEEPYLDSLSFFYKDDIRFKKYARAPFYKTLLNLRKTNPALTAYASFKKLPTNNDDAMYCFERGSGDRKVLVILNLSDKPQNFSWKVKPSVNKWYNVFNHTNEPVYNGFAIEPWGYAVYETR